MAVGPLINFDGSTYINRASALGGVSDGKQFTLSTWIVIDSTGFGDGILATSPSSVDLVAGDLNGIKMSAVNSAGSTILEVYWPEDTVKFDLVHLYIAVDLADTAKRHVLIDGADVSPTWNIYTNSAIRFTVSTEWLVGSLNSSADPIDGGLGDLWFDTQYLDPSTYLSEFYNNGSAIDLGSDGSLPTGTAPLICFNKEAASWHINAATDVAWTENGTLTKRGDLPQTFFAKVASATISPALVQSLKLSRKKTISLPLTTSAQSALLRQMVRASTLSPALSAARTHDREHRRAVQVDPAFSLALNLQRTVQTQISIKGSLVTARGQVTGANGYTWLGETVTPWGIESGVSNGWTEDADVSSTWAGDSSLSDNWAEDSGVADNWSEE